MANYSGRTVISEVYVLVEWALQVSAAPATMLTFLLASMKWKARTLLPFWCCCEVELIHQPKQACTDN